MLKTAREKYIAIAAGVVVAALVLDSIIFTPLTDRARDLDTQLEEANAEMVEGLNLRRQSQKLDAEWRELAGRVVTQSQSEAESQVLNHVRQWAQTADLSLTQLKPDNRSDKQKDFYITTFRAAANGDMAKISRFLYEIEKASIPIRITDLTVASKREGTDDLTLNLSVSTIYLPRTAAPTPADVERSDGSEARS